MLQRAKNDLAIHEAAIALFYAALQVEQRVTSANQAVDGIETICGVQEALPFRLWLLKDPRMEMVHATVESMRDPFYLPTLIECLSVFPSTDIRIRTIRRLGAIRDPAAFGALVSQLRVPALRPYAAQALGAHRNPAAIPHLQPLLTDTAPAWREDERGGSMLRVCDIANDAIESIRGGGNSSVLPPREVMR